MPLNRRCRSRREKQKYKKLQKMQKKTRKQQQQQQKKRVRYATWCYVTLRNRSRRKPTTDDHMDDLRVKNLTLGKHALKGSLIDGQRGVYDDERHHERAQNIDRSYLFFSGNRGNLSQSSLLKVCLFDKARMYINSKSALGLDF